MNGKSTFESFLVEVSADDKWEITVSLWTKSKRDDKSSRAILYRSGLSVTLTDDATDVKSVDSYFRSKTMDVNF